MLNKVGAPGLELGLLQYPQHQESPVPLPALHITYLSTIYSLFIYYLFTIFTIIAPKNKRSRASCQALQSFKNQLSNQCFRTF